MDSSFQIWRIFEGIKVVATFNYSLSYCGYIPITELENWSYSCNGSRVPDV